jgi:hypothetical protein
MSNGKTLLAKAKASVRHRRKDSQFSPKQVERLALAYLTAEITFSQVEHATGKTGSTVYTLIAPALRRQGAAR